MAANCVLGFINSSTARRLREKFICFYSALIRLCLDCLAQVLQTAQYRKDIYKLGQVQQRMASGRSTCSVRRGSEMGLGKPGKEMA